MNTEEPKPVVLTCAQPTGRLTLGNYLGAIRNWSRMLDDYECYFGIVDQHAITNRVTAADLRRSTLECLAVYLAAGLDPSRARIFLQSHVVGHTELAWVLGCLTPIGDLQRMTQFKEKAARLGFAVSSDAEPGGTLRFSHQGARAGASVNAGLLYYPVLMAADILLYNADVVPTGDDQRQHLELCRDLAHRFNTNYSETFKIPEPYHAVSGARIMSLQDPTRKMSKSDENENASLFILDGPDQMKKKIMSAVTDSGREVISGPDKPGISNLLQIFAACCDVSLKEAESRFSGSDYGTFKKSVADAAISMMEPVQKRYHDLVGDRSYLESVLREGQEAAQKQAYRTLSKVYRKVGFLERPR